MTRHLHDTRGQYWTSVIRALDVAEIMEQTQIKQDYLLKAKEAAVLGLEEMRKQVRNWNDNKLTPDQWIDFGSQSLNRIQELTNVLIQHQLEDIQWELFFNPSEIAETLIRTMIEGVTNAIRHGKASTIKISLHLKLDYIQLIVRDDGIGLTVPEKEREGIGLLSLRSLAEDLGGHLVIEGAPYRGTTLFLSIPFHIYKQIKG